MFILLAKHCILISFVQFLPQRARRRRRREKERERVKASVYCLVPYQRARNKRGGAMQCGDNKLREREREEGCERRSGTSPSLEDEDVGAGVCVYVRAPKMLSVRWLSRREEEGGSASWPPTRRGRRPARGGTSRWAAASSCAARPPRRDRLEGQTRRRATAATSAARACRLRRSRRARCGPSGCPSARSAGSAASAARRSG